MNNYDKKDINRSSLKVPTIADLISPEEFEELSKLSSNPPKRSTCVKMTKKNFEWVTPLEPRHKLGGYRALKSKLKTVNVGKVQEALLWNAIYGNKSFRICDWNILFNYLLQTAQNDNPSVALAAILRITAGAKPTDCKTFESSLYSVRQIVSYVIGKKLSLNFCSHLQKMLGVNLPTSVENLDNLLDVSEIKVHPKKSPEPARIGVGYKDKGTLSKTPKEEPLGEWIEQVEDCFLQIHQRIKYVSAFDSSFDKKKRKKYLSHLINHLEKYKE